MTSPARDKTRDNFLITPPTLRWISKGLLFVNDNVTRKWPSGRPFFYNFYAFKINHINYFISAYCKISHL